MIDLTIHPEALEHNLRTARENGILIPTFRQMKHPDSAPDKVKAIQFLSQHGAFLITKSGDKVAKYFGISKYTLYSYIDTKQEEKQHE